MSEFTLPPSPNWYQPCVIACRSNTLVYGARYDLTIINIKPDGSVSVSLLCQAHKDKINVVVFSPLSDGNFRNCLASCGDDGFVRVWNIEEQCLLYFHSVHKDGLKVNGLDWSRADPHRLVSINDSGSIVCWDLASNTTRQLHCGAKQVTLCLACCPHDRDLVAIGCKGGVTLVFNIKSPGNLVHRLRGHEKDVTSVSWCPVPYNVFTVDRNASSSDEVDKKEIESDVKNRDLLLATGGLEKSIFIWRAGSDGRYEVVLSLPNYSMTKNTQRKKGYTMNSTSMMWTCVLWVDAYRLLSTSQFGELLSWDLHKKCHNKKHAPDLLHSRHNKCCFNITCPVVYNGPTMNTEERVVWSAGMDKHLIAFSLGSNSTTLDIPTMGGVVFSMAISPLDPNRLAIGNSDGKIFVWNTSNVRALDITVYWKKIIGKVMSLCWHPLEENWLAYGTSDGHIGLLDVGSNKIPVLFRLHHRKAVYRLIWTVPILKSDNPAFDEKPVLYSVGDGDILQYTANPLEPDEEPKSLNSHVLNNIDLALNSKTRLRSEIVFKPDMTSFAVGNDDGSVYVLSCKTLKLLHAMLPHKKLINNLEWHPETVTSDNHISPFKDWLATSCENIKVYNIHTEGQAELVATLSGHSEKIVSLAWSPHINGRLISASYDSSVQVWDIPNQSCVGVYLAHSMAVMCVLFSPQDPDIVISGSNDSTVRLWNISQLTTPSAKHGKRKDRLETTLKERSAAQEATDIGMAQLSKGEDILVKNKDSITCNDSNPKNHQGAPAKSKEERKKLPKQPVIFAGTGSKLAQANHFEVLFRRWAASTEPSPAHTAPPTLEESPAAEELEYLDFFSDDKTMHSLLKTEESRLTKNRHYLAAQHSAFWRGDVTQMIKEAIVKKQLSDWLVSLAPTAGFDIWEEACVAYASQLEECGEVLKASSYLLATHKAYEAARLLANYKMFKEAIAIAKCRLPTDNSLIAQLYLEWGETARMQGQFTLAAHCFLMSNNVTECIEILARSKDLKSLKMASYVANHFGHNQTAETLAIECLTMCVVANNFTIGYQLIKEMPQYQYWSVWLKASELLAKVKNRKEVEVFDWLEGRWQGNSRLIDELNLICLSVGEVYEKLIPHIPTVKNPEFEREMWCVVSIQLSVACCGKVGGSSAQFLRHIVSALSAAFHYQTTHPQSLAVLLTLMTIDPAGLFTNGSVITEDYSIHEEQLLIRSLKAFICASIVHWINNNWGKVTVLLSMPEENLMENGEGDSRKESVKYKMTWLPELLTKCTEDVLDEQNVSYYVKKAQKKELENVISKKNMLKNIKKSADAEHDQKLETVINNNEDSELVDKEIIIPVQSSILQNNLENSVNLCQKENVTVVANGNGVEPLSEAKNEVHSKHTTEYVQTIEMQETEISTLKKQDTSQIQNNVGYGELDSSVSKEGETNSKYVNLPNSKSNSESCKVLPNTQFSNSDIISLELTSRENGKIPVTLSDSVNNHNVDSASEKNNEIDNGSAENQEQIEVFVNSKLNEIKELDSFLQKFETDRISVPCPFTAFMNIKFVIENIIRKQNDQEAQRLLKLCEDIWKKSFK